MTNDDVDPGLWVRYISLLSVWEFPNPNFSLGILEIQHLTQFIWQAKQNSKKKNQSLFIVCKKKMCALKIIICMRVKSKNIVVLRFGVSEDLLPTQVGFLKLSPG